MRLSGRFPSTNKRPGRTAPREFRRSALHRLPERATPSGSASTWGTAMAFKWLEAWLGSSGEPHDPAQALVRAAYDGARVQVQIENSLIRFDSHLSVKSNGQVMVGKPAGLNGHLTAGSMVRVRLPGREKHDA